MFNLSTSPNQVTPKAIKANNVVATVALGEDSQLGELPTTTNWFLDR